MTADGSTCAHCRAPLPVPTAESPPPERCPSCGKPLSDSSAAGKSRPIVRALVALTALAAIVGSIAAIYRDRLRKEDEADPFASREVRALRTAGVNDPGLVRSRLSVLPGGARAVVALGRPQVLTDRGALDGTYQGLLARELVRQAVLIAARDELGLGTRDEVLGESSPAPAGRPPVEVGAVFRPGVGARAFVTRGEGEGRETLLTHDLLGRSAPAVDLAQAVAAAEAMSRTELPGVLKQIGLQARPGPVRDGGDLPGNVEGRLALMSYTQQLAAAREVHEAIRSGGESPRRLGALARAYANLGVLTEFHWDAAHKAFKARALLYAQRLAMRDPGSASALWHRAYAEALTGLHRAALDDLDRAGTLASSAKGAATRPGWVDLISAYCRYDMGRLDRRQDSLAELAAMLRLLTLEYPTNTAIALKVARETAAVAPSCFRAHDTMARVGGIANLHVATVVGPQLFERRVPGEVRLIESLPASVREPIERKAGTMALAGALVQAGEPGTDAGEPSWAALGHLLRETRFVHVFRRLHFMRYQWSVPVGEFWSGEGADVGAHPFRPLLELMAGATEDPADALAELNRALGTIDAELTQMPMVRVAVPTPGPNAKSFAELAIDHADLVARDLSDLLELMIDDSRAMAKYAHTLLEVSPRDPLAMSNLIDEDRDFARPHLAEWTRQAGETPTMLAALARYHAKEGRPDDSARFLTQYVKQSPDHWAYKMLADSYRQRGDKGRWKATLDEFLERVEDHGLDHARTRVEIADDFMERQQWSEAQPYAEAAARTWAGWAMQCAIRCYEGMEDWERAELWTRRLTERYPESSWALWFLFCKRTGHGDVDAASRAADRFLTAIGDRPDVADPDSVGQFYWLRGEPGRSIPYFRKAIESSNPVAPGISVALLADDEGDTALRDETLKHLTTKLQAKAPKTIRVCELFREALARGPGGTLDLKAVDEVLAGIPAETRGNTEFFVGWFLRKHGKPEDARRYLERSAGSDQTYYWTRLIAADALRQLAGRSADGGRP